MKFLNVNELLLNSLNGSLEVISTCFRVMPTDFGPYSGTMTKEQLSCDYGWRTQVMAEWRDHVLPQYIYRYCLLEVWGWHMGLHHGHVPAIDTIRRIILSRLPKFRNNDQVFYQ